MKYALINGKILNGHQDMEVETGKAIFIENEKIVAIEPYRNLDKSYQIIDLQGKYILPGLINMHVHLAGNGKPQKKQKDNEKTVKMLMSNPLSRKITYKVVSNFAKIELMSGVTTIRTVGGIAHYDSKLRDEILKEKSYWSKNCCPAMREFLFLMVIWQDQSPLLPIIMKKL